MKRKSVVILAFPGVTLFDIAGPADVFNIASSVLSSENIIHDVTVASMAGGATISSSRISIYTERLSTIDPASIDTLIVTGGSPPFSPPIPVDLVDWLRTNAET